MTGRPAGLRMWSGRYRALAPPLARYIYALRTQRPERTLNGPSRRLVRRQPRGTPADWRVAVRDAGDWPWGFSVWS